MAKKSASKPKKDLPEFQQDLRKPTVISDELCEFLGKPHGCELANRSN